MSFIQREIDRIRFSLFAGSPNAKELYAAQQALAWALEPRGIKAPFDMVMGIPEGSVDCSEHPRRHPSLDICSRNG